VVCYGHLVAVGREYGVGNRKLCWLHVVGDTLSTTFTMSDAEEIGWAVLTVPARFVAPLTKASARPAQGCWPAR
jgi:hypothetical protein